MAALVPLGLLHINVRFQWQNHQTFKTGFRWDIELELDRRVNIISNDVISIGVHKQFVD